MAILMPEYQSTRAGVSPGTSDFCEYCVLSLNDLEVFGSSGLGDDSCTLLSSYFKITCLQLLFVLRSNEDFSIALANVVVYWSGP